MKYSTQRSATGGVRYSVSNPPEIGAKLVKTCGGVVTYQGIGLGGMLLCTDGTGAEHLLFPQQIAGPFVAAKGLHEADLSHL